jgi:hypothetical protein
LKIVLLPWKIRLGRWRQRSHLWTQKTGHMLSRVFENC